MCQGEVVDEAVIEITYGIQTNDTYSLGSNDLESLKLNRESFVLR